MTKGSIYDIFIENDTFVDIETYVGKLIDDIPEEKRDGIAIHEFLNEIGKRVKDEGSFVKAAADMNVPVFSPGFLDSMLGIPLWMYSKQKKLVFDPIKDFDLLVDMVFDAKKSGAIILGGGTPKHHTQYMHTLREGLDAAINEKPDLIILDFILLFRDSFEVAKNMKQDDPQIPILILTLDLVVGIKCFGTWG